MVKYLNPLKGSETRFVKGPREEVITVTFNDTSKMLHVVQTTKFDEIMDTIKIATKSCGDVQKEDFSKCVAKGVVGEISKHTDSKQKIVKYRDMMSSRLRNYTCDDSTMTTTEPERVYPMQIGKESYNVNVHLDLPASKIWSVNNFITQEECDILLNHGTPLLKRATVAAEDGSSVVSEQ